MMTPLLQTCMVPDDSIDTASGLQARILHEQQAIICSSKQLGQLVIVGSLVLYQPPVSGSAPASTPLEKLLEVASKANQAAEAAYNSGVIRWEQVRLSCISFSAELPIIAWTDLSARLQCSSCVDIPG